MLGKLIMRRKRGICLFAILTCISVAHAQRVRRSKPPTWKNQAKGVFFQDAFREGLRGDRPEQLGRARLQTPTGPPDSPSRSPSESTTFAWSKLISASSIEDEIKQINIRCGEALQSEGFFKAQGYLDIRQHLGTAAVLFAVIDRYDSRVRWTESAVQARDAFARGALNAKVGSSQVFREVTQLRQGLADLIRGSRWPSETETETEPLNWGTVADRKLLMQRLETCDQEVLGAGVASATEFSGNRERLRREAELAALLGHVLKQDGLPEAGDPDYDDLCDELTAAAKALEKAVEQQDQESAQRAHGELKRSCVNCHEIYRV